MYTQRANANVGVNINVLQKLLAVAIHPTTVDNEALSAIRKVGQLLKAAGKSVNDLVVEGTRTAPAVGRTGFAAHADTLAKAEEMVRFVNERVPVLVQAYHASTRLAEMLEAKKQEINKKDDEIARQKRTIEEQGRVIEQLRQQCRVGMATAEPAAEGLGHDAEGPTAVRSDDICEGSDNGQRYVAFEVWQAEAARRYGRDRWLSEFSVAAKVPMAILAAWKKVGTVPGNFVEVLDSLSERDLEPVSRKRWSAPERLRLRALVRKGRDDLEIAVALTNGGRKRGERSVARMRRIMSQDGEIEVARGAGAVAA